MANARQFMAARTTAWAKSGKSLPSQWDATYANLIGAEDVLAFPGFTLEMVELSAITYDFIQAGSVMLDVYDYQMFYLRRIADELECQLETTETGYVKGTKLIFSERHNGIWVRAGWNQNGNYGRYNNVSTAGYPYDFDLGNFNVSQYQCKNLRLYKL